jgi:hypothetical protein
MDCDWHDRGDEAEINESISVKIECLANITHSRCGRSDAVLLDQGACARIEQQ